MADAPKPVTAKGHAKPRTDDDLDRLAMISPSDIADGSKFWRDNAPRKYRGLVDAKPHPEQSSE